MNLITSLPSEHVQKFPFPNSSEWHMRVLVQTLCLFSTASLSSTMNPMLQWLWTFPSTMMQRFQIFVFTSCCLVAKLFPTLCDPMEACQASLPFIISPLSSCLQSFPASRSFAMSWLFASSGQSVWASASVLPVNIQDWFPLGLTGLILLFKRL